MSFGGEQVQLDKALAAHSYLLAANQGSTIGQRNMGGIYLDGEGLRKSQKKACLWFAKAARRGCPITPANLAFLFIQQKTPSGLKEAVRLLKASADQCYPPAEYLFGYLHLIGHGVLRNVEVGLLWLKRAADRGFVTAQNDLALFYFQNKVVKADYRRKVLALAAESISGRVARSQE